MTLQNESEQLSKDLPKYAPKTLWYDDSDDSSDPFNQTMNDDPSFDDVGPRNASMIGSQFNNDALLHPHSGSNFDDLASRLHSV